MPHTSPTESRSGPSSRLALVTGGSGNLGRYVLRRLLRDGLRVHVPVFDPDRPTGLDAFLGDDADSVHFHAPADLSDPDSVASVFAAVESAAGHGPDILVNLAGGFAMGPVESTEPETWDRMLRMNATTAFLCSRAAFPSMQARGWGRIVNVSAFPAIDRGKPLLAAYGAAKAAVLNLTHTLAREGRARGVTVNAVLPSIIDTPANRKAQPEADTGTWLPPDEIAAVIAFLLSDEARIVSGAAVPLTLG